MTQCKTINAPDKMFPNIMYTPMTDLKNELELQKAWRIKPNFTNTGIVDQLVRNEFLSTEERETRQNRQLQQVIRFASLTVPYYQSVFAEQGLTWQDVKTAGDLHKIPILDRESVKAAGNNLKARQQIKNNPPRYHTSTSGSSGSPLKILQSSKVGLLYALCKQRDFRWLRADPMKTFASIVNSNNVTLPNRSEKMRVGEDVALDEWRYVGHFFETGPTHIFLNENAVADQIDWLQKVNPAYFSCTAQDLEIMAMVYGERAIPENLQWIQAVSQDFNADMRRTVDGVFHKPVHQNYGLNEIGYVAGKCPVGRKYHVFWEHSIVEILDDDDQPCPPGTRGRLIVTSLSNYAMPLIRYDTGDIGEAAVDACECGRNMPSFANIHGRYRRIAFLPETTSQTRADVRDILRGLPESTKNFYSRTQLHQDKQLNYTLTFETGAGLPADMLEAVETAWSTQMKARGLDQRLALCQTEKISYSKGGKYQNFTSDYIPGPSTNYTDE